MTTYIQSVTICEVSDTTFTINCGFLDDSDTNCIYILLSREGVVITAGAVDRSNSGGKTIVATDIDGSQLLAYGSDLMLDDVDLFVRTSISSVQACPVGTTGKNYN